MKIFPRCKLATSPFTILGIVSAAVIAAALSQASPATAFVPLAQNCRPRSLSKTLCDKNKDSYMRFKFPKIKSRKKSQAKDETEAADDDNVSPQTWNPLRLAVMKLGFTELRYTSPLNYEKRDGVYNCAYCGLELFDSDGKYDSGSGWPSFWRSSAENSVAYQREWDGRVECLCANQNCKAHLGHVFLDGPRPGSVDSNVLAAAPASDPRGRNPDTGNLPRFCVNGAALKFEEKPRDAFPFGN